MVKYSIVVPAYNEEQSLQLFYDAVVPKFESLGEEYEIIFVNDGSRDATKDVLRTLCEKDKRVKAANFSRNFGQQAALLCGFKLAKGQAVIAMDADLQDPPEVALQMIEKWKQGFQVVHGKRRARQGESAFKKRTASLFYKIARRWTNIDIPQSVGDFKLYDRAVVNAILSLPEHDRLLRVQTAWVGFSQTEVEFDRPERIAGQTHYTLKKMIALAKAGIFPNTQKTLSLPLKTGLALTVLSVSCFAVFAVLACLHVWFGGLTAWLFPSLGLATGLILCGQGMTNIHVGMIYKEVQNRPQYIIDETFNLD